MKQRSTNGAGRNTVATMTRTSATGSSSTLTTLGIFVCILASTGCVTRRIGYEMTGIPNLSAGPWASYRVAVAPFEDQRPSEFKARRGEPLAPALVSRAGGRWYQNSDEHLDDPSFGDAVGQVFARHLAAAQVFRAVESAGGGASADLTLTGAVHHLEAYCKQKLEAEFWARQGGLLTMPIALAQKTPHEARAVLSATLTDSRNGRVLWTGKVEEERNVEEGIANSPWGVYQDANVVLKAAITKLVTQLAQTEPQTGGGDGSAEARGEPGGAGADETTLGVPSEGQP